MRRREREKIIEKTQNFSRLEVGGPLYFRPYEVDNKKIEEISKFTGEKKSAVAQKLVHLALAGKELKFSENGVEEKVDWLIRNTRQTGAVEETIAAKLHDLSERLERIETSAEGLSNSSESAIAVTAEIFCMTSIAISSLNQIFTKLLEFLSPVEVERKYSVDVANRVMAALIEHSVEELKSCAAYHDLETPNSLPDDLYIYSKLERLEPGIDKPRTVAASGENAGSRE